MKETIKALNKAYDDNIHPAVMSVVNYLGLGDRPRTSTSPDVRWETVTNRNGSAVDVRLPDPTPRSDFFKTLGKTSIGATGVGALAALLSSWESPMPAIDRNKRLSVPLTDEEQEMFMGDGRRMPYKFGNIKNIDELPAGKNYMVENGVVSEKPEDSYWQERCRNSVLQKWSRMLKGNPVKQGPPPGKVIGKLEEVPTVQQAHSPATSLIAKGHDSLKDSPWVIPLALATLGGTGGLGYLGIKNFLGSRRKKQLLAARDKAQQEFANSLLEERQSKLSCAIDHFVSACEEKLTIKQASNFNVFMNILGALALASGGMGFYNGLKSEPGNLRTIRALRKARERQLALQREFSPHIEPDFSFLSREGSMKTAAEVVRSDPYTRGVGHALGGVMNTLNLMPGFTRDWSPYREGDVEDLKDLVQSFEEDHPQELSETRVLHGGGIRPLDTLKRHFTNKRTGPLGKVVGIPTTLSSSLMGGLLRQPLYSPYTDEVYAPWDNTGVDSHELGHVIDFNSAWPGDDATFGQKQWSKLKRDIYPFLRTLPGGATYTEGRAWQKALAGVKSLLEKKRLSQEKGNRLIDSASQMMTPALTSYVISDVGKVIPAMNAAQVLPPILGLTSTGKSDIANNLRKGTIYRKLEEKSKKDTPSTPREIDKAEKRTTKEQKPSESKVAAFSGMPALQAVLQKYASDPQPVGIRDVLVDGLEGGLAGAGMGAGGMGAWHAGEIGLNRLNMSPAMRAITAQEKASLDRLPSNAALSQREYASLFDAIENANVPGRKNPSIKAPAGYSGLFNTAHNPDSIRYMQHVLNTADPATAGAIRSAFLMGDSPGVATVIKNYLTNPSVSGTLTPQQVADITSSTGEVQKLLDRINAKVPGEVHQKGTALRSSILQNTALSRDAARAATSSKLLGRLGRGSWRGAAAGAGLAAIPSGLSALGEFFSPSK